MAGGGLNNERPGTDHVISGPMRGLQKTASDGAERQTNTQTGGHCNSVTELAQWGRLCGFIFSIGQFSLVF